MFVVFTLQGDTGFMLSTVVRDKPKAFEDYHESVDHEKRQNAEG
jgi:hypothetical protein